MLNSIVSLYTRPKWIPLEKCKDSYVYYIHARNAKVGIFNENDNGFIISRYKFDENFLFTEYHWDTGEPYGTVKPLKKLYRAKPNMTLDETLIYLNMIEETIQEDPWYKYKNLPI
jgi:hypothetical protein